MTVSRNACLLAAALCGLAAMVAAAAAGMAPALMAALAAVSVIDLFLGAVGVLVAAISTLAGLLVISDARADLAIARAWHDAATGSSVGMTAAAGAPYESGDRPTSDPQSEMVRRILIAHRFDWPQAAPQQMASVDPRQGARACETEQLMQGGRPTASGIQPSNCAEGPRIGLPLVNADCALRLVAAMGGRHTEAAVHAKRLAKGTAASRKGRRLLANGGPSHFWPQPRAIVVDDLVATDGRRERNSPDQNQHSATDGTTTDQPACRGPPRTSGQVRFREKHRPPTGEIVVTVDFGDRVPIGAAELEVIEAYLDDVLRDVLGGHRADRGSDIT